MRKLQILIVVADGLGDRPVPQYGRATPLELAVKPHINSLLRNAVLGLWDPIAPGIRPGSDTAHLSLFGENPLKKYPGRGPFEAIGAGAELRPGDIALRGNFATVDDNMVILDRRAGRKVPENREFVEHLNNNMGEVEGVEVRFYSATEHRLAVVIRGEGLSPEVTDTDPHEVGVKVPPSRPKVSTPEAEKTARIVTEITFRSHQLLKDHPLNKERVKRGLPPANIVLLRGAGKMINYIPITERVDIDIEKAAAVSATAMIKGVCRLLGMEVYTPLGATGGVDTDVIAKARKTVELIKEGYDLVYLHFKGTDAASHDGNPDLKKSFIEKVDQAIGYIVQNIDMNSLVMVFTGDHTTPVSVRDHTGDPVPVMIVAPNVFPDRARNFSERDARLFGTLGRLRGNDLIRVVLDLANRVEKFGA